MFQRLYKPEHCNEVFDGCLRLVRYILEGIVGLDNSAPNQ